MGASDNVEKTTVSESEDSLDIQTDVPQSEDPTVGEGKRVIKVSGNGKINVSKSKNTARGEVEKAIVLRSEKSFGGKPDVVIGSSSRRKKKKKKKKQSSALKPWEKAVFRLAKRYDEASSVYRRRHEKSNKKKKNGWLKDLPKNYGKAMSKLVK
ncbi:MAG: hypothetical protein F6J86_03205 [Symploca sp. SIO1B1]|nr:hypothetical protein [Symploca sp. SIO1C2]NER92857.1 hypothetical protein [Symploca sp. SIO1B1]